MMVMGENLTSLNKSNNNNYLLNLKNNLNNNNGNFTSSPTIHQIGFVGRILLIFFYGVIIVLALGGNSIVCYIILSYQRMRSITNYFIFNLSISDILMTIMCIPFSFVSPILLEYWPFGWFLCPVVSYVQSFSVLLSAFTLVAMSIDRYIAIMRPLKPRMTTSQAILIIAIIWFLALSISSPTAIVARVDYNGGNSSKGQCHEIWSTTQQQTLYSLIIMISQYFLPLGVLMFTYGMIACAIWGKKPPGEKETNRDQRMAKSKRKMVKMMIVVCLLYTFFWLPLHTVTLIGDSHYTFFEWRYSKLTWTLCHWLAMSNCCTNPLVYCWMNSRFRQGFKRIFRFCPCVKGNFQENDKLLRQTIMMTLRGGGGTITKAAAGGGCSASKDFRRRNNDFDMSFSGGGGNNSVNLIKSGGGSRKNNGNFKSSSKDVDETKGNEKTSLSVKQQQQQQRNDDSINEVSKSSD